MSNEATRDRIKRNLDVALDGMRSNLDRVELLALALDIFSRPVLDYEPRFHHAHAATLVAHEMERPAANGS